ncbi:zonular occludens toxin domain-containing protein [Glaesserella parasuis]|uniref:zonular occludens toxin domain-containing protein n=1 Tax=Glaesserella parasuis TaxID=738 RepID=UPI0024367EB5|nr:zonular occludens toxin domain-containing protein [Glaesserella parasuis]MDG6875209.1 zonular occludens toxin domain-containing protein [Glaesserella parasuis]
MAINAYVGTPGSGKTYEVVKSVILPAFLSGRSVVTNIEGVSQSNFIDYADRLNSKRKEKDQIDYASLGSILKVTDDDCLKPNFFPYKGATEPTIAKNGDLICIDEIWRIFDEKGKIHDNHRSFIAEHRHFVNEKGQTSDLVVINQSVANIPRFIKDRVESTFKMTKLIALGLSKRYKIDVYSGVRLFKTTHIQTIQAKYDDEIFSLYKSYDGAGVEQRIDKRVNLLKSTGFIFKMGFALFTIIAGGFYLYHQFSGKTENTDKQADENISKTEIKSAENTVKQKESVNNVTVHSNNENREFYSEQKPNKAKDKDKGLSQKWRIIGYLKKQDNNLVILSDDKVIRYEYLSNSTNEGNLLTGYIDGYRVTFYSGQTIKKEKGEEIQKWSEK